MPTADDSRDVELERLRLEADSEMNELLRRKAALVQAVMDSRNVSATGVQPQYVSAVPESQVPSETDLFHTVYGDRRPTAMPTAAEIKTRAEMDKLRLHAAAEELKGRVESAKRRSELQQRMINVAAKLAGDKKKEEEKAEKEAKIPLEPTPTPFNLQNVISGKESGVPQVAMDTERGMPSDGGGQLGQVIRDAMGGGSAPLTQRQTSVEWGPHPYGFGYVPMPTRRTTTTEIPTGMTQYQRAMLAQRQMEVQAENKRLEARTYWLNQQTKNEMESQRRQDLLTLSAALGSVDDAMAFLGQDVSQMSPELKQRVGRAIEKRTGEKIKAEKLDQTLEMLKVLEPYTRVSKNGIQRKIDAGVVTDLSQVGLDELVGLGPLGSLKDRNTAYGQWQAGGRALGAKNFASATPAQLWTEVGAPASHFQKMVVETEESGWFSQSKFGYRDAREVFGLMVKATVEAWKPKEEITKEDRAAKIEAQDELRRLKVVGEFPAGGKGRMQPVPEGQFSETSRHYIDAFYSLCDVQQRNPELVPKTSVGGILGSRLEGSRLIGESREAQMGVGPAVRKEVIRGLVDMINQTWSEAR